MRMRIDLDTLMSNASSYPLTFFIPSPAADGYTLTLTLAADGYTLTLALAADGYTLTLTLAGRH